VKGAEVELTSEPFVGDPVLSSRNVGLSVAGFVGWVTIVGGIEGLGVVRVEGVREAVPAIGDREDGKVVGLKEVGDNVVGDNVGLSDVDGVGILVVG
jgi:hypothetical protein